MFDLIREHNLFTAVRDQVLLLVEFDQELMEKKRKSGVEVDPGQSAAITLLVDNIHSIPVRIPVADLSLVFNAHVTVADRPCGTTAPDTTILSAPLFGCSVCQRHPCCF